MRLNLFLAGGSVGIAAFLYREEPHNTVLMVAALAVALLAVVWGALSLRWPRWNPGARSVATITALLALLLVIVPGFLQVQVRRATAPQKYVHDGALQVELAADMLRAGKNPYVETYRGTPLERWSGKRFNPAVDHLVYLPGQVLLALGAGTVSRALVGYYDDRFLTLAAYLASIAVVVVIAPTTVWRLRAAIGVALNPLLVPYIPNGRNDTVVFLFLAIAFALLAVRRPSLGALAFGIACAVKTFAWFLAPAFVIALVAGLPGVGWTERIRRSILPLLLGVAVAVAVLLPFVLWNPSAFIDDTVRYPAGSALHSYPIKGGGLSVLLLASGIVRSENDYYPFWIFQVAVYGILGAALLPALVRRATPGRAAVVGGAMLFGAAYTARFFTENHVGLILLIGWLAAALLARERTRPQPV